MGKIASMLEVRSGAIKGVASELHKDKPDTDILALLVVQYMYEHRYIRYDNVGDCCSYSLVKYAPISMRDYIYDVVSYRNIVAHALYTNTYKKSVVVRKYVCMCALDILNFETKRILLSGKELKEAYCEFWGYDRSDPDYREPWL